MKIAITLLMMIVTDNLTVMIQTALTILYARLTGVQIMVILVAHHANQELLKAIMIQTVHQMSVAEFVNQLDNSSFQIK